MQKAFGILETSIESALKKFSDTVLHTAECMTRTICFKTGAERNTNKCFDRKRVTKKRDVRRSLNRLKRTKPVVDRLTCRQKRVVRRWLSQHPLLLFCQEPSIHSGLKTVHEEARHKNLPNCLFRA